MRALDPKRSISFLQTGQSAKSMFCKLECSEAAIDDFTLPAMNRCSYRSASMTVLFYMSSQ